MKHLCSTFLMVLGLFIAAQAQTNYLLEFDGQDDYATYYNSQPIETGVFSMAARIKTGEVPGYRAAILTNGTEEELFFFGLAESGYLTLDLDGAVHQHPQRLDDERCYHVAFTVESELVKLYIDGSLVYANYASTDNAMQTQDHFYIGNNPQISDYAFSGAIDDVEIWASTRTAAEIDVSANNEIWQESDLGDAIALLPFSEGTGEVSGNLVNIGQDLCVLASDDYKPSWEEGTCGIVPAVFAESTASAPCAATGCELLCNGGFEIYDPEVKTTPEFLSFRLALRDGGSGSQVSRWVGNEGYFFVREATSWSTDIPTNFATISPGVANLVNTWDWPATGNNAYAALSATTVGQTTVYENSLTYTLDAALSGGARYDFSFWGFANHFQYPASSTPSPFYFSITLKNSTNSNSLVLIQKGEITDNTQITANNGWEQYAHNFVLTAAQGGLYDQIEIKALAQDPSNQQFLYGNATTTSAGNYAFVDDFSLQTSQHDFADAIWIGEEFNTNNNDFTNSREAEMFIKVDAADNIYVAKGFAFKKDPSVPVGMNNATNDLNVVTMHRTGAAVAKYAYTSCGREIQWMVNFGSSDAFASLIDMEVSADGKVFLLGHFRDQFRVENTILEGATRQDGENVFLVVYDAQGQLLDAKDYGSYHSGTTVTDMEWDEANQSLYVLGHVDPGVSEDFVFEDLSQSQQEASSSGLNPQVYKNFFAGNSAYIVQIDFKANNQLDVASGTFEYFPPGIGYESALLQLDEPSGRLYVVVKDKTTDYYHIHEMNPPQPNILQLPINSSTGIHDNGSSSVSHYFSIRDLEISDNRVFICGIMSRTIHINGTSTNANYAVTGGHSNAQVLFGYIASFNKSLSPIKVKAFSPDATVTGHSGGNTMHSMTLTTAGEPIVSGVLRNMDFLGTAYDPLNHRHYLAKVSEDLNPIWLTHTTGDNSNQATNTDHEMLNLTPDEFVSCGFIGTQLFFGHKEINTVTTYRYSTFVRQSKDLGSSVQLKREEETEQLALETQSGGMVYPNPTRDQLTIRMADPSAKLQQVEVIDLTGKQLLQEAFNGAEGTVQLNALPTGIYILRIQSNEGVEIHRVVRE